MKVLVISTTFAKRKVPGGVMDGSRPGLTVAEIESEEDSEATRETVKALLLESCAQIFPSSEGWRDYGVNFEIVPTANRKELFTLFND